MSRRPRHGFLLIVFGTASLMVAATMLAEGSSREDYLQVVGPCAFQFPKDHGTRSGYRTERWYYTGNVKTNEGKRFGLQLTFFRRQLQPLRNLNL